MSEIYCSADTESGDGGTEGRCQNRCKEEDAAIVHVSGKSVAF